VTPIECSIVCNSAWAQAVFEPAIKRLPRDLQRTVKISKDAYAVFSVISAGMDAGSRVVDLTSPLALAGIPIFFITTYYSDFILVPVKARQSVVQALLARGFEFSEDESSFKTPAPSMSHHGRGSSQSSIAGDHMPPPPSTPPPSSVGELQTRTFETLKKRSVVPYIEPGLFLVQCSGREKSSISRAYSDHRLSLNRAQMSAMTSGNGSGVGYGNGNGGRRQQDCWIDTIDTKLYTSIISALVSQPRFLSVTLTEDDPPSLLLDKSLLGMFGDSLVGPTEGTLVPIFLDLVNLPFEATGIVSGVAGRLVRDMHMMESAELSYLSTARAGAVILSGEQSRRALEILEPLLVKSE